MMARCMLALATGVLGLMCGQAPADISIAKLFDTSTVFPEIGAAFASITDVQSDGDVVAFRASRPGSEQGIYLFIHGALTVVADQTTGIPDGTGMFTDLKFHDYTLVNDEVVFIGEGPSRGQGIQNGVYHFKKGSLSTVANTSTSIPQSSKKFGTFVEASYDGATVVFSAQQAGFVQPDLSGVFRSVDGGAIETVINAQVAVPGTPELFKGTNFTRVVVNADKIAFRGASGNNGGIYLASGGSLEVVTEGGPLLDETEFPNAGMKLIAGRNPVSMDGDDILLLAEQNDQSGYFEGEAVYVAPSNQDFSTVVDFTMPYPETPYFFWSIWSLNNVDGFASEAALSKEGPLAAFRIGANNGNGSMPKAPPAIWARDCGSGVLTRIVGVGDELDGRVVQWPFLSRDAISGSKVVFSVYFADGSWGAFAADLAAGLSGDLNDDGNVDGADLGLLLASWGMPDATADLNGDGNVDGADLGLLLGAWTS